jgi:hypothetical protein
MGYYNEMGCIYVGDGNEEGGEEMGCEKVVGLQIA